MKRNLQYFTVLLLLVIITSCAQKIISNKAESYTKKPKRIFIESVYPPKGAEVSTKFAKEMGQQLIAYSVQSTSFAHSNLSFDTDEDIFKKAFDFNADAVMVVRQTYDAGNAGSFIIALYDAETKKPFWKSTFDIGMGDIYNDQSAQTTVKSIIKKLIQDGVMGE